MACQGLQKGETLQTLKRESENLKKKLDEERNKLNDVECKCVPDTMSERKSTVCHLLALNRSTGAAAR